MEHEMDTSWIMVDYRVYVLFQVVQEEFMV